VPKRAQPSVGEECILDLAEIIYFFGGLEGGGHMQEKLFDCIDNTMYLIDLKNALANFENTQSNFIYPKKVEKNQ